MEGGAAFLVWISRRPSKRRLNLVEGRTAVAAGISRRLPICRQKIDVEGANTSAEESRKGKILKI